MIRMHLLQWTGEIFATIQRHHSATHAIAFDILKPSTRQGLYMSGMI